MRIALAKKHHSYVMKAPSTTSLYHSVTEKRKIAIFAPSTEKGSWENRSNIWLLTFQCLDSSQSWCFQSTDQLPKCNNENLEQSLQEVRTSGRQRSRTLKEVSLGKETACFIFFPHPPPTPLRNLLKGNTILFPAAYPCQLSYSTSRSHIHSHAVLSDKDSVSLLYIFSTSGQAWIPLLNFVILSHLDASLAVARVWLIHLPQLLFLQLLNSLFFHYGPVNWGSYLFWLIHSPQVIYSGGGVVCYF